MITKIYIENFRSIVNETIELGKINLFTGGNSTGKSSVLYALLCLKQTFKVGLDNDFKAQLNIEITDLGGFSQIIYNHDEDLNLTIGIQKVFEDDIIDFKFEYSTRQSKIHINKTTINANDRNKLRQITSNTVNYNKLEPNIQNIQYLPLYKQQLLSLYQIDNAAEITPQNELVDLLIRDLDLRKKVSLYFKQIFGRRLNVAKINSNNYTRGVAYLETIDERNFHCNLVNEGHSVIQVAHILTKALMPDATIITIDELEAHLHPSVIAKLLEVLIEIANGENKQFLISTHSEPLVMSLLRNVHSKKIRHNDAKVYFFDKKQGNSIIENQKINELGQLEGGLKSFFDDDNLFFTNN
jgi:AAA15 family ATPase/GTPase